MSDIDQKLPPPDWDRHRVWRPGLAPVGDPIRWGGVALTTIGGPYPPGPWDLSGGAIVMNTNPIVNVGSSDNYARSWSIVGTLRLPYSAWETDLGSLGFTVHLEATLGIGQISFTQRILLMQFLDGESLGLCNQQSAAFGGPYLDLNTSGPGPGGATVNMRERSFAAIGALVGNTVAIRGTYLLSGPNEWTSHALLSLGVAPMAAGEGI